MATAQGDGISVPDYLADLKEELTVIALKARADIIELGQQSRYTHKEAAHLAECGVTTIKEAIAAGKLKVGGSGWITRPQLAEWLGYDPIDYKTDRVIELQRRSTELTRMIEALFEEHGPNRPIPAESVTKIDPAA